MPAAPTAHVLVVHTSIANFLRFCVIWRTHKQVFGATSAIFDGRSNLVVPPFEMTFRISPGDIVIRFSISVGFSPLEWYAQITVGSEFLPFWISSKRLRVYSESVFISLLFRFLYYSLKIQPVSRLNITNLAQHEAVRNFPFLSQTVVDSFPKDST